MMILIRGTLLCLLALLLSGVQQTPLQPTTPPLPEQTPASVIAMPGSSVAVDDSTHIEIPALLQLVIAFFGGAAGLQQLYRLLVTNRLEAAQHRRQIERAQTEREKEQDRAQERQIDTLLALLARAIERQERAAEQQEKWLTTVESFTQTNQRFTEAIARNNLIAAEERGNIQQRQQQIMDTLEALITSTNNNTTVVTAGAQEAATLNVLVKVLITMLARGSDVELDALKDELRSANVSAVNFLNSIEAAEARRRARESEKPGE